MSVELTESEWQVCTDPLRMIRYLRGKFGPRKWLLFAAACCRWLYWEVLPDGLSRRAIAVMEQFADQLVDRAVLQRAFGDAVGAAAAQGQPTVVHTPAATVARVVGLILCGWNTAGVANILTHFHWNQLAIACHLLREIAGNPFQARHMDPLWLTWKGGVIPALARGMYDSRDFADMPILADALEEAGCGDPAVLSHCRKPGPHVRGCWVLDWILGRP